MFILGYFNFMFTAGQIKHFKTQAFLLNKRFSVVCILIVVNLPIKRAEMHMFILLSLPCRDLKHASCCLFYTTGLRVTGPIRNR